MMSVGAFNIFFYINKHVIVLVNKCRALTGLLPNVKLKFYKLWLFIKNMCVMLVKCGVQFLTINS